MAGYSTMNNLFDDTSLPVIQPRSRRQRRCRACGETGHDRRTCSRPEEVERRRVRSERLFQSYLDTINVFQTYLFNNNPYKVEIFEQDNIEENYAYRKFVVNPFTQISLKGSKDSHFYFIPQPEVIEQDVIDITKNHILVFDCLGSNFRESHELRKDYVMPKKPIEQWKECGLKSLFLLKELERLGAHKNENYEAIMDMVQDIPVPNHNQFDLELAGVPSTFTNIT